MLPGDQQSSVRGRTGRKGRIQRRLAAVLGADIVGYSALMVRAEEDTYKRVGAECDRVSREIERAHGLVFNVAGDGVLAEFPSAVEALKCALRVQADTARRNARLSPEERITFRIGLNSGEIMVQENRTGGTTINVAARLEAMAEPGGVTMSAAVFEQVRRTVSASYKPVGEQRLKNIRDPIMVYAIPASACSSWINMPALPRQSASRRNHGRGCRRISAIAGGAAVPHAAEGPIRRLFRRRNDRRHHPRTRRPEGSAGDRAQLDDRLRAHAAGCAPRRPRARCPLCAARQRPPFRATRCGSPSS